MIRSSLLSELPWLEHGFGTRNSPPLEEPYASLRQIHSTVVYSTVAPGVTGEGDGLITHEPQLAISVRTADCYPILLADERLRVIAALHAGWRGISGGIVHEALHRMRTEFGSRPADIRAAVGPGIGACCYWVGEEVAQKFGMRQAGKIDLAGANRQQLMEEGLAAEKIEVTGLCTHCETNEFFSYRREKENAGRMISWAKLVSSRG